MRYRSLLFFAVLIGCGEEDRPRMPAQDAAFARLRTALVGSFPADLLHEPDVRWWSDPCPGTETSAVVLSRRCYSGLYYRPGGVDVAFRGSIGHSAYSHELMHYFLDQAGLGKDAAHEKQAYWDLVERIDLELQDNDM